ncbi:MAG: hypothetical protein Aurels2KO_34750 [Aureliella sp.]
MRTEMRGQSCTTPNSLTATARRKLLSPEGETTIATQSPESETIIATQSPEGETIIAGGVSHRTKVATHLKPGGRHIAAHQQHVHNE